MAKNEEWRAACNEVNCKNQKETMPEECNVILFGHDEKMQISTCSDTRGIVPKEIELGTKITAEEGQAEVNEDQNIHD